MKIFEYEFVESWAHQFPISNYYQQGKLTSGPRIHVLGDTLLNNDYRVLGVYLLHIFQLFTQGEISQKTPSEY